MSLPPPLLEARDLVLRCGKRLVLDRVSLVLEAGEVVGLLGPNGSGKSTLLETLVGAREPDAGTIELEGKPLGELPAAARARRLTLVAHARLLEFGLTVGDLVAAGRTPHLGRFGGLGPEDRHAVEQALDTTRTRGVRQRNLSELSAGERQRAHLARALAQRTRIVLLDEPTACMDLRHQAEALRVIRRLAGCGGAVMIALHDLVLAARFCDRLLMLREGRIAAATLPGQTLDDELVHRVFGSAPIAPAAPRSFFVLGGARSGKSRFAQRLALHLSPRPIYLATSQIDGDEQRRRVERHRAERGPEWTTIEEPERLSQARIAGRVVVVDCLTLWLNNCFASHGHDPERTLEFVTTELDRLLATGATLILVSNELGQGVHAATELGRRFTDLQGFLNQHAARRADAVVLMVAGIAQRIKGRLPEGGPHTAR